MTCIPTAFTYTFRLYIWSCHIAPNAERVKNTIRICFPLNSQHTFELVILSFLCNMTICTTWRHIICATNGTRLHFPRHHSTATYWTQRCAKWPSNTRSPLRLAVRWPVSKHCYSLSSVYRRPGRCRELGPCRYPRAKRLWSKLRLVVRQGTSPELIYKQITIVCVRLLVIDLQWERRKWRPLWEQRQKQGYCGIAHCRGFTVLQSVNLWGTASSGMWRSWDKSTCSGKDASSLTSYVWCY